MEIKKAIETVEKKTGIDLPDEKIEKIATKENIDKAREETINKFIVIPRLKTEYSE